MTMTTTPASPHVAAAATPPPTSPITMTTTRKIALTAGLLYLATFVFSIPVKFALWADVLDKPDFILGAGNGGGIHLGAIFELLTALTGVGTAVVLYPLLRRRSERAALGFVTTRVIEAAMIFTGVLAILSIFTLRNDVAGTSGADSASLLTTGHALLAIHDWTFLIGPGLMASMNAFCLATVMYRSRLVPRIIPTIGLIGAPLLLASCVATIFDVFGQLSGPAAALAMPIALWEFSLGVWMTVKGFRPSPIADAFDAEPAAAATSTAAAATSTAAAATSTAAAAH